MDEGILDAALDTPVEFPLGRTTTFSGGTEDDFIGISIDDFGSNPEDPIIDAAEDVTFGGETVLLDHKAELVDSLTGDEPDDMPDVRTAVPDETFEEPAVVLIEGKLFLDVVGNSAVPFEDGPADDTVKEEEMDVANDEGPSDVFDI
ncbi:MAG: hypothetical protein Q9174_003060 [Haloplaca sp. 1 TL-2023]